MSEDVNRNLEDATVSTETIESIDDFLPMPGAESIVTSDEYSNKNVFSSKGVEDLSFLSDDKKVNDDSQDVFKEIDEELETENQNTDSANSKSEKGVIKAVSKLIEDGVLFGFEDEKPIEEYTAKDIQELIQLNIEERERILREQTPKEFFESLPEELQYAAEYVAKGGQDLKGLFKALAEVEEQKTLDPGNPNHQEAIVRKYLHSTNFGEEELIEEQIQEWLEAGVLGKKASVFKPKLDKMEQQVIEQKLAQQEAVREEQKAMKEAYMENIYNTLKPAEINGVKLDPKRQKFLWDELTTVKYQTMTGRNTNLLGKLLEEYQFGEKPRYDLIAETLWLLSDPDDYKENIKKQASNQVVNDTVRTLKTEEGRKLSTHVTNVDKEDDNKSIQRKIQRKPANIFARK